MANGGTNLTPRGALGSLWVHVPPDRGTGDAWIPVSQDPGRLMRERGCSESGARFPSVMISVSYGSDSGTRVPCMPFTEINRLYVHITPSILPGCSTEVSQFSPANFIGPSRVQIGKLGVRSTMQAPDKQNRRLLDKFVSSRMHGFPVRSAEVSAPRSKLFPGNQHGRTANRHASTVCLNCQSHARTA